MVSNEFDHLINKINNHKSKLVVITHPLQSKNKNVLEEVDRFLDENKDYQNGKILAY